MNILIYDGCYPEICVTKECNDATTDATHLKGWMILWKCWASAGGRLPLAIPIHPLCRALTTGSHLCDFYLILFHTYIFSLA